MSKVNQRKKVLPSNLWKRGKTGRVICQCGVRVGSEYDGLCFDCRGGISAHEDRRAQVNRSDAVNLARNLLTTKPERVTEHGVLILVSAVLDMDAKLSAQPAQEPAFYTNARGSQPVKPWGKSVDYCIPLYYGEHK